MVIVFVLGEVDGRCARTILLSFEVRDDERGQQAKRPELVEVLSVDIVVQQVVLVVTVNQQI